jgi:predicted RecB family nuclease
MISNASYPRAARFSASDVEDEAGVKTDWTLYSYGLKEIAKNLGFGWTAHDAAGAHSIAWYAEYLEDPIGNRALLDRIIQYNEEDCQALAHFKDHLARHGGAPPA